MRDYYYDYGYAIYTEDDLLEIIQVDSSTNPPEDAIKSLDPGFVRPGQVLIVVPVTRSNRASSTVTCWKPCGSRAAAVLRVLDPQQPPVERVTL